MCTFNESFKLMQNTKLIEDLFWQNNITVKNIVARESEY